MRAAVVAVALAASGGAALARPTLTGPEQTFGHTGGGALVHYTATGADAVPAADADASGVPDFVEEVAGVADAALVEFADAGFRAPLSDAAIADNGGDGRVDLYLKNLGAADGSAQPDSCSGNTCIGHMASENDYAGLGYPSVTEGIRSVVPHEVFHLVQYAYDDDQPQVWTEATAVWATELMYGPDNADFERFVDAFIERSYRPLERGGGGFGDVYVYGAAVWPYFLEHRFEAAVVRDAWTNCGDGTEFLAAIDGALADRGDGVTVDDAFTEFTRWNLYTGDRADRGNYPDASGWGQVPFEDPIVSGDGLEHELNLEGLSARYANVTLGDGAWRVVATPGAIDVRGYLLGVDAAVDEGVELVADGDVVAAVIEAAAPRNQVLVLTGLSPNTITTKVPITIEPYVPEDDDGGGGCSAAGGASGGGGLVVLLGLALAVRRRRAALVAVAAVATTSTALAQPANEQPAPAPDAPAASEPDPLADADGDGIPDGSVVGEIIVVTGTRSERPASSSTAAGEVVTREDLDRTGARTVADALATRPGVWVERTFGRASVSLQNLGPEYTLVLVDGRRQIGRVDGVLDLDRIQTGGVERVEIVRGAGSALYGSDALGGIVNVITADPTDRFASLAVRHDSLDATDLSMRAGDGRKRLRWQLGAGIARGDGYDRNPGDLTTTASAFDEWRVDGKAAWVPADGARVSIGADYLRRDLTGISATGSGAVFDNRNLDEQATARIDVRWPIGDRTIARGGVAASEFRDQFLTDQRASDALDDYQESIDRTLEGSAQVERRLGDRNLVTAGVDGLVEALESPRLADGDGSRTRGAAFVQDELRLGAAHQILVVPAVRADGDSQFGFHATPRLGARWDVSPVVALRGSYGWGYRAPDFKQLYLRFENPGVGYVIEGDPDLGPETSQTASIGADIRAAGVTLTVDAYRTDLADMIGFVLDEGSANPQRFIYANIAAAHVQGVDAGATWQRGRLGVRAAYSLSFTRDEDLGRELDGKPRHRGSVELSWADLGEGFTAVARVVATGRRVYFADLDGDGVDDERVAARYAVIGGQLAKRFGTDLHVYLGLDNLLDEGDAELTPIAPRTLYVGMEARI
jgi:outer membrane receptor for ferrienterochelin and colicins